MEFAFFIFAGAFSGGFVNGLSGFGTSMAALVFWLHVAPPSIAVPMALVCSMVGHLQTLPIVLPKINLTYALPFIIGGVVGVPLGVYFLSHIADDSFKRYLGLGVIGYCTFMLLNHVTPLRRNNSTLNTGVGFLSGILGGLAGLSGLLLTIWAQFQHWDKDTKRGVFQAFNMTICAIALITQLISGLISRDFFHAVSIALPGTIIGVWFGHRLYQRLGDHHFNRVIYAILTLAGVALIGSSL